MNIGGIFELFVVLITSTHTELLQSKTHRKLVLHPFSEGVLESEVYILDFDLNIVHNLGYEIL